MNKQLTVIAFARARRSKIAEAREALFALVAPTRAEKGCINYDLHQSDEDPTQFVFYENWESDAALEAHANSPHLQAFRKISGAILDGPAELTRWRAVSKK
ncbi:MAG TPA: putative quinol monooxygenase [Candidatus Acidoferrales bacterium]|nr:putative quinol monooxygenase [Candidatus Acidoferrales bacterium]